MYAIESKALTKRYGRARGVEGLDLCVEQGAFYGLIGPNGAGKSTTERLLLGLLRPTAGSARVLGLDVCAAPEEILRRVGYLPSESRFWPGTRVGEVLALSAALRGQDCTAAARRLCERLRLDPGQRVERLSLGNRKKLGIVCALQHDPALLILDEPTSGLDPLIRREFFDLLAERHARGAAVFLSSHDLGDVQRLCSHAAVLRAGKLAAVLDIQTLTAAGKDLETEFLTYYRKGGEGT